MRSTGAGLQIEGVIRESNLRSAFIPAHAQTSNQYTAVLYSNLSKENKEGDFVAAIRKQFPAIEKVSVELEAGASAVFVSVPGLSRKIPLALFSNAASNLASILLNIAGSSHGIVCVDEIENGFHYTKYHRVWDQIRTFANDFETQIFASTHSAECLRAVADAFKDYQDEFSLIQIVNENGIAKAFVASGEDAGQAIQHGLELRK
jgi:predicted ATPase